MTYRIFISGQKYLGAEVFKLAVQKGLTVTGVSAPIGWDKLGVLAKLFGVPVTAASKRLDADRVPEGTDLIVCAHSYEYVTAEARRRATYGGVGYHPSLLPDLKGRRAVEEAVEKGYRETGGSIYVLEDGWDTGTVLLQERVTLDVGETPRSLWLERLCPLGLKLYGQLFDGLIAHGPTWDAGYTRSHTAAPDWEYCYGPSPVD